MYVHSLLLCSDNVNGSDLYSWITYDTYIDLLIRAHRHTHTGTHTITYALIQSQTHTHTHI